MNRTATLTAAATDQIMGWIDEARAAADAAIIPGVAARHHSRARNLQRRLDATLPRVDA